MKTSPPVEAAKSESVWAATAEMPRSRKLSTNAEADVCIVGAGIAGLTTGYLLTQAGKRVVILDDGPMASGMTQVTTAHLTDAIDNRFMNIEKWHGERGAFLAAESHSAAIQRIECNVRDLDIDCDFAWLNGYLFLAPGDEKDMLDRELAAARRAGLKAEMVPARSAAIRNGSGHPLSEPGPIPSAQVFVRPRGGDQAGRRADLHQ